MSKVSVADYLINSLSIGIPDYNDASRNQTINRIVDVWSKRKYISPTPKFAKRDLDDAVMVSLLNKWFTLQ